MINNIIRFSIKNKFSLADSDIVLIEVALGGNACGTLYYFVTISHRGAVKITDEIGACEEEPKLKFNGSELTIKFSNKTYIYSNGKFTENGKPYKKF